MFEKSANSLEEAARLSRTEFFWYIYDQNDYTEFNFDWKPAPWEYSHIHVFPSQWQKDGGVYLANKNTVHNMEWHWRTEQSVIRKPSIKNWQFPENITLKNYDLSWHPDPYEPPYLYHFSSQHQSSSGLIYKTKGATDIKFCNDFRVISLPDKNNWVVPEEIDENTIDFSWHPNALDIPYVYHFSSQHQSSSGLIYKTKGATDIKFCSDFRVVALANKDRWFIPEEIDENTIDFSWHPNALDIPYVYHFSSDWYETTGLTYTVKGATEIKIIDEIPTIGNSKPLKVLDIFFIDRGNRESNSRYELLKVMHPHIQKVRYANSMLETINRCCARSTTNSFWVISSQINYTQFDFTWHPENWQKFMTHVFASQWNKWSDTYLINRKEFEIHKKWCKKIEEFQNLNFVSDQKVYAESDGSNIYYVDHGNTTPNDQLSKLQTTYPKIRTTRFVDNYLDTFKRIMTTADTEYVWIISSLCDYDNFDFTWHPEVWQAEMIHVFPSGEQRRGDTFFIHVESFKQQMYELEILDWFNVINYCEDQTVYRFQPPTIVYDGDSLVDSVKTTQFNFPYATFVNSDDEYTTYYLNPCLWAAKDRSIRPITSTSSTSVIPREARSYINTQIYDYPYIDKDDTLIKSITSDIIFISYDEPQADENWNRLLKDFPNAKRVHGVDGMHNALIAAANTSSTKWFYAVFAKTKIAPSFKFDFQPDFYQLPKHYIFHAKNVMNDLQYGHMGIVLYNVNIIKNQTEFGVDYTMSAPHAVIPELSAIAEFNSNPYHTWRTAFRECAKLSQFTNEHSNIENEHRLDVWLTQAKGKFSEWCLQGARDGHEFYMNNKENSDVLKQAFNWKWLQKHFENIYKNINEPNLDVLAQRQEQWQHPTHFEFQ